MKELKYNWNHTAIFKALWLWDMCYFAYNTPNIYQLQARYCGANYIRIFQNHPDYMFVIRYVYGSQGYLFFIWSGTLRTKYFFGKEGNFNIFPIQEGYFPEGLFSAYLDHENFVSEQTARFSDDYYVFCGHSRGSQLAGISVYYQAKAQKICDYVGFGTPPIGTEKFAHDFMTLWYQCSPTFEHTCVRVNTVGDIFSSNRVDDYIGATHIGDEILLPGSGLKRWRIISRIFRHTPKTYNKIIKKRLRYYRYKPVY